MLDENLTYNSVRYGLTALLNITLAVERVECSYANLELFSQAPVKTGNIQLVKVLFCKPLTNSNQLPAYPRQVRPGFEVSSKKGEKMLRVDI